MAKLTDAQKLLAKSFLVDLMYAGKIITEAERDNFFSSNWPQLASRGGDFKADYLKSI